MSDRSRSRSPKAHSASESSGPDYGRSQHGESGSGSNCPERASRSRSASGSAAANSNGAARQTADKRSSPSARRSAPERGSASPSRRSKSRASSVRSPSSARQRRHQRPVGSLCLVPRASTAAAAAASSLAAAAAAAAASAGGSLPRERGRPSKSRKCDAEDSKASGGDAVAASASERPSAESSQDADQTRRDSDIEGSHEILRKEHKHGPRIRHRLKPRPLKSDTEVQEAESNLTAASPKPRKKKKKKKRRKSEEHKDETQDESQGGEHVRAAKPKSRTMKDRKRRLEETRKSTDAIELSKVEAGTKEPKAEKDRQKESKSKKKSKEDKSKERKVAKQSPTKDALDESGKKAKKHRKDKKRTKADESEPLGADGGGAAVADPPSIRELIKRIFEKHNPSKLHELDDLLSKYAGAEADVYASICEKYGETPTARSAINPVREAKTESSTSARVFAKKAGAPPRPATVTPPSSSSLRAEFNRLTKEAGAPPLTAKSAQAALPIPPRSFANNGSAKDSGWPFLEEDWTDNASSDSSISAVQEPTSSSLLDNIRGLLPSQVPQSLRPYGNNGRLPPQVVAPNVAGAAGTFATPDNGYDRSSAGQQVHAVATAAPPMVPSIALPIAGVLNVAPPMAPPMAPPGADILNKAPAMAPPMASPVADVLNKALPLAPVMAPPAADVLNMAQPQAPPPRPPSASLGASWHQPVAENPSVDDLYADLSPTLPPPNAPAPGPSPAPVPQTIPAPMPAQPRPANGQNNEMHSSPVQQLPQSVVSRDAPAGGDGTPWRPPPLAGADVTQAKGDHVSGPRRTMELDNFLGEWRDSMGHVVLVERSRSALRSGQLDVQLSRASREKRDPIRLNVKDLGGGRFACGHYDMDTERSHRGKIVWVDCRNSAKTSVWER